MGLKNAVLPQEGCLRWGLFLPQQHYLSQCFSKNCYGVFCMGSLLQDLRKHRFHQLPALASMTPAAMG